MQVLSGQAPEVIVEEASAEEAHDIFDSAARRLVGMSGREFLERYDDGEIVEDAASPGVTELVTMLPFARA